MKRVVALYALALAAVALALQWLHYQYAVRVIPTQWYILALVTGFTVLGVWIGRRLSGGTPPDTFRRNDRALTALGITEREHEVLERLARGETNQQMADRLFVSPNTIKTHLKHLYTKLDVNRRTEALRRARELRLIP